MVEAELSAFVNRRDRERRKTEGEQPARDHEDRVNAVLGAITAGAADRVWSMRYEVDDGLRWDHQRGAWIASSEAGHAYDGERLFDYSRNGTA
jgi:hypothetical protein